MARSNLQLKKIDQVIGEKIREFRASKGWGRDELAARIDCTQQQLQKYEVGSNRITIGRLILIAKALDVPIELLYQEAVQVDDNTVITEVAWQKQRACLELIRNFMEIINPEVQMMAHSILSLLSKTQKNCKCNSET